MFPDAFQTYSKMFFVPVKKPEEQGPSREPSHPQEQANPTEPLQGPSVSKEGHEVADADFDILEGICFANFRSYVLYKTFQ